MEGLLVLFQVEGPKPWEVMQHAENHQVHRKPSQGPGSPQGSVLRDTAKMHSLLETVDWQFCDP